MLRRFGMALCVAATVGFAGYASAAEDVAVHSSTSGPYSAVAGSGGGGPQDATILYTDTTQTGSRFQPGNSAVTLNPVIAFDDVPIPVARLAGGAAVAIQVTRVTYGIRSVGGGTNYTVNPYWTTFSTTPVAPDTEIDTPLPAPNQYAPSQTFSGAVANLQLAVFGNGSTVMFTAPLNYTVIGGGFGSFALGMSMSGMDATTSGAVGWRITAPGPDANADVFWEYDAGNAGGAAPNPEGAFIFSTNANPRACFYLIVEGTPVVPEPASLSVLGLGLSSLILRRRR